MVDAIKVLCLFLVGKGEQRTHSGRWVAGRGGMLTITVVEMLHAAYLPFRNEFWFSNGNLSHTHACNI